LGVAVLVAIFCSMAIASRVKASAGKGSSGSARSYVLVEANEYQPNEVGAENGASHHDEGNKPSHSGLRVDFDDLKGNIRTFFFDKRPLGIIYNEELPLRTKSFKFNAYAQHAGVEAGWKVKRVADTEVNDSSDMAQIKNLIREKLKGHDIWPLRLDFDVQGSVKTFMMDRQPIGIEFHHNRMPITIQKVYPQTLAARKGIQAGWKIMRIGTDPVGGTYIKMLQKFRDAVDLLDKEQESANGTVSIIEPVDPHFSYCARQ